jgi:hypothetical protein
MSSWAAPKPACARASTAGPGVAAPGPPTHTPGRTDWGGLAKLRGGEGSAFPTPENQTMQINTAPIKNPAARVAICISLLRLAALGRPGTSSVQEAVLHTVI